MKFFSRSSKTPPTIPTNWSATPHSEAAELEVGYEAALPFLATQPADFDELFPVNRREVEARPPQRG